MGQQPTAAMRLCRRGMRPATPGGSANNIPNRSKRKQVPDESSQLPSPIPTRRRTLQTARDIQRELARLYWELREGLVDPALGGRLCFVLMSLLRAVETSDIEARVERLEGKDGSHAAPSN